MEKIIHILFAGAAYCGQPGLPLDWPEGHRWIAVFDYSPKHPSASLFCPGCVKNLLNEEHLVLCEKADCDNIIVDGFGNLVRGLRCNAAGTRCSPNCQEPDHV